MQKTSAQLLALEYLEERLAALGGEVNELARQNEEIRRKHGLARRKSLLTRLTGIVEGEDEDSEDTTTEEAMVTVYQGRVKKLEQELEILREENKKLLVIDAGEVIEEKREKPSPSSFGRGVWSSVSNVLEGDTMDLSGTKLSFESNNSVDLTECATWSLERLMQETEKALESNDPDRVAALQLEVDRRVEELNSSVGSMDAAEEATAAAQSNDAPAKSEMESKEPEPRAGTEPGGETVDAEIIPSPSFSNYPKQFSHHDPRRPNQKIITKRRGFRPSVFEPRRSNMEFPVQERTGYMEKRTRGRPYRWQTRFFRLKGHYLTYYPDRHEKKMLAAIDLNAVVSIVSSLKSPNSFYLLFKDDRKYHLRCLGAQDSQNWKNSLEAFVQNTHDSMIYTKESPADARDENAGNDDASSMTPFMKIELQTQGVTGQLATPPASEFGDAASNLQASFCDPVDYADMSEEELQREASNLLRAESSGGSGDFSRIVSRLDALEEEMARRFSVAQSQASANALSPRNDDDADVDADDDADDDNQADDSGDEDAVDDLGDRDDADCFGDVEDTDDNVEVVAKVAESPNRNISAELPQTPENSPRVAPVSYGSPHWATEIAKSAQELKQIVDVMSDSSSKTSTPVEYSSRISNNIQVAVSQLYDAFEISEQDGMKDEVSQVKGEMKTAQKMADTVSQWAIEGVKKRSLEAIEIARSENLHDLEEEALKNLLEASRLGADFRRSKQQNARGARSPLSSASVSLPSPGFHSRIARKFAEIQSPEQLEACTRRIDRIISECKQKQSPTLPPSGFSYLSQLDAISSLVDKKFSSKAKPKRVSFEPSPPKLHPETSPLRTAGYQSPSTFCLNIDAFLKPCIDA